MSPIPMLNFQQEYLFLREKIDAALKRCIEHQTWILGPEVQELEEALKTYLGARHCIGISNGTDALVLALRALSLSRYNEEYFSPNQQIVTTPFTFTATGDSILRTHATPVFVDIDPLTYNIDPVSVSEYVAKSSNVVGILPVHLYGCATQLDQLTSTAKKNELFVLEDVAQAFGAKHNKKSLGTIGDLGTYSFFPSKNLGGWGDGGLVATDDDALAQFVKMLLKHGGKDKYNVEYLGYNARLDTIQAAILLAKLPFVDEFNQRRRALAMAYSEGFQEIEQIRVPVVAAPETHVFHQYTLRILGGKREELQKHLASVGIASMVYYPVPLHQMKLFKNRAVVHGSLANAEKAAQEVLSLPIEPLQSASDTEQVINAVRSFFNMKNL